MQKVVSLSVDGEESQLVFIDHAHTDMSVRKKKKFKGLRQFAGRLQLGDRFRQQPFQIH